MAEASPADASAPQCGQLVPIKQEPPERRDVTYNTKVSQKEAFIQWFSEVQAVHGGPGQYLNWKYDTKPKCDAFAIALKGLVPAEDVTYVDFNSQSVDKTNIKLHCSQLTFLYECTTRLWPYPHVCKDIFEDILTSGFRTDTQPLVVMTGEVGGNGSILQYVKGMGRACTLLALLDCCLSTEQRPCDISAQLHQTCANIAGQYRVFSSSSKAALENAQISARSATHVVLPCSNHECCELKFIMLFSFFCDKTM